MSSLHELAIDLINDAKGTRDAQGKLFLLEQVKEICFHRDRSVLPDIMPSMLDFMVEKAVAIRKFLIGFSDEAMNQDAQLTFPYFLNLLNFLVAGANDNILALLARSFCKYYEVVVMKVVTMPIVPKAQGLSDPKQLWQMFTALSKRFNDCVIEKRTDAVKSHCLRLLESEMIFGLPNAAAASSADPRLAARKDPRLARAAKTSTATAAGTQATTGDSSSKSAEEIPLHHPFISRNEIQSAAEECFTKVMLWSSKGGPQNTPFSPALMSVLGQVIANVASARLKHVPTAANALVVMLQSKNSVAAEMSGADRGNLARAVHRLLRSAAALSTDSEGVIPKLRTAVAGLEALGLDVGTGGGAAGAEGTIAGAPGKSRKRGAESISGDGSTGADEDVEEAQRRSSAIAALDAAEQKMKSQGGTGGLDVFGEGGDDDAIALLLAQVSSSKPATSAPKKAVGLSGMLISGDTTELAKDLAAPEDFKKAASLKLVTTTPTASAGGGLMTQLQPLPPSTEGYGDLALHTLQKLLEGYRPLEQTNPKMVKSYAVMCVKTTLSMAVTELKNHKNLVPVQIVSIIPTALAGKLSPEVPPHVTLPRSLWVFLAFAFGEHAAPTEGEVAEGAAEDLQRKVEVLVRLCGALQEEVAWAREEAAAARAAGTFEGEEDIAEELQRAYDALCVTAMSRMLQIASLRSSLAAFMLGLPRIPIGALAVLKLLMATGSKGPSGEKGKDKGASADLRGRGTRAEALHLLAQVVFSQDEVAGKDALLHVLKQCLSDDFEMRSKVINLVVSEVVHVEDWCDEIVMRFAVQAMIHSVGVEAVQAWLLTRPEGADELLEHDETNAMEVADTEGAGLEQEQNPLNNAHAGFASLRDAFQAYESDDEVRSLLPPCSAAEREAYAKRSIQLLSQLSLVHLPMLSAFTQLYSAWTTAVASGGEYATVDVPAAEAVNSESIGDEDGYEEADATEERAGDEGEAAGAEGTVVAPVTEGKPGTAWTLAETLQSELRNILPAIAQTHSAEAIFDALCVGADASVRPLLEFALAALLADFTIPPTPSLIQKVYAFIAKVNVWAGDFKSGEQDSDTHGAEEQKDTGMDVEGEAEPTPASTTSVTTLDGLHDPVDFRLVMPLLGGLPGAEIEAALPRIVGMYAEDKESLKIAFGRITKARPPPMSKVALLLALHRMDFEAHNLKAKTVLDAIDVPIQNKADFNGEVFKEAIKTMLAEEHPPVALMRTAILSAQSFPEVKRYVLGDVMPQLVRRRIWTTSPKLWDGVVAGAKNLAAAASAHKNAELTLRALLGVPAPQLKGLVRVAPTVKGAMSKLLKTLSSGEKEEVVSGKWAGIADESGAVSEEKQQLIAEIAAYSTL